MEYITVKLFKVSQESVYLDIIADCLEGYIFNKIELQVRSFDHYGNSIIENNYGLTDVILDQYPYKHTSNISARIPLSELFGEGNIQPSMYSLTLGCTTDSGLTLINFDTPYYKVKVGDKITKDYAIVEANNLVICNSKELSKIRDDEYIKVDGNFLIYTEDGELLSRFPENENQEFYLAGGDYKEYTISSDALPYISLPENKLTNSLYFKGTDEFFNYSGGTGIKLGGITPKEVYDTQGIYLNDSYGNYLSIISETGKFKSGDTLHIDFKRINPNLFSKFGIAILRKNQVVQEIAHPNYNTEITSFEYVLTDNDIQENGEIKLVMNGYSNTCIKYLSIVRSGDPEFPKLVISGEFIVPKFTDPNIESYDTTVYTSDTNGTFQYLMDNILNLENSCTPISDDLIRNYLILYGHLQAMQNGQQSIAEEYFKILAKNFTKCGTNNRVGIQQCGCNSHMNNHPSHNYYNCRT